MRYFFLLTCLTFFFSSQAKAQYFRPNDHFYNNAQVAADYLEKEDCEGFFSIFDGGLEGLEYSYGNLKARLMIKGLCIKKDPVAAKALLDKSYNASFIDPELVFLSAMALEEQNAGVVTEEIKSLYDQLALAMAPVIIEKRVAFEGIRWKAETSVSFSYNDEEFKKNRWGFNDYDMTRSISLHALGPEKISPYWQSKLDWIDSLYEQGPQALYQVYIQVRYGLNGFKANPHVANTWLIDNNFFSKNKSAQTTRINWLWDTRMTAELFDLSEIEYYNKSRQERALELTNERITAGELVYLSGAYCLFQNQPDFQHKKLVAYAWLMRLRELAQPYSEEERLSLLAELGGDPIVIFSKAIKTIKNLHAGNWYLGEAPSWQTILTRLSPKASITKGSANCNDLWPSDSFETKSRALAAKLSAANSKNGR